jgi:hypothetical protein
VENELSAKTATTRIPLESGADIKQIPLNKIKGGNHIRPFYVSEVEDAKGGWWLKEWHGIA